MWMKITEIKSEEREREREKERSDVGRSCSAVFEGGETE